MGKGGRSFSGVVCSWKLCDENYLESVPQNGEQEEEGMLWDARHQGVSQRCFSLLALVLAPAGAPAEGSASKGEAGWGEARLFHSILAWA